MATDTLDPVPSAELDPDSQVPLYRQIARILRREIEAGALTGKFPSQKTVADRFGVQRAPTVSKAFAELKREQLIETVPGIGTWVKSPH